MIQVQYSASFAPAAAASPKGPPLTGALWQRLPSVVTLLACLLTLTPDAWATDKVYPKQGVPASGNITSISSTLGHQTWPQH